MLTAVALLYIYRQEMFNDPTYFKIRGLTNNFSLFESKGPRGFSQEEFPQALKSVDGFQALFHVRIFEPETFICQLFRNDITAFQDQLGFGFDQFGTEFQ